MNFHILMAASHLSISNGYFQSKMNETMQQRGLRSTGCDAETDMVKPWRAGLLIALMGLAYWLNTGARAVTGLSDHGSRRRRRAA
jgi:hypothetical protein